MDELVGADDPIVADVFPAPPATPPKPGGARRTGWRRPAVLAGAGVALSVGLAAGGYGIASATTQLSGSLSGLTSSSTSTTTPSSAKAPAQKWAHRSGGGFGRAGRGPGGLGGGLGGSFGLFPGGVVKAIGATSVTITRPGGTTVTVTTNASTQYREGLVKVSRGELAVGERVSVRSAMAGPVAASGASSAATSTTPIAASEIDIILPDISGKVVSVSGSTIVVQDGEGFWRTVAVSSATVYESAGKAANESSIRKGELVVASGTIESDHTTLKASAIAVLGTGSTPATFQPGSAPAGVPAGFGPAFAGPGPAAYGQGAVPQGSAVQ